MGTIKLHTTNKIKHNTEFFKEPNTLNSYWAGFIAADGCIQQYKDNRQPTLAINLKSSDINHLERFKQDIEYNGIVRLEDNYIKDKKYRRARLAIHTFTSNAQYLADNFKITPCKSLTLEFPSLSEDNLKAYCIGYIDGDGCFSYTQKSKGLRFNLLAPELFLNKFNAFTKLEGHIRQARSIYRLEKTGSKIVEMFTYLNIDVPRLDRKWSIVQKYLTWLE